jgi:hypothetical protein
LTVMSPFFPEPKFLESISLMLLILPGAIKVTEPASPRPRFVVLIVSKVILPAANNITEPAFPLPWSLVLILPVKILPSVLNNATEPELPEPRSSVLMLPVVISFRAVSLTEPASS